MAKKFFDNINMNANNPAYTGTGGETAAATDTATTATATEEPVNPEETFEHEGVKIYTKTGGNVTYFDANSKEVASRVVDILFEKYPAPPEFNQQGGEKKGDLQVRDAEYETHGKEVFESGKKPEYVVERQDYTEGDSYIVTIPKEHHKIVKFLRGEVRPPEVEEVKPTG